MRILYFLEWVLSYLFYLSGMYFLRKRLAMRKGLSVILVYHRIKEGRGGIGDEVTPRSFDWQMRYIMKNASPVTWKELLQSPLEKGKIKVLVTFDDGFRDSILSSLQLAEKYSIPLVIFGCTKIVFANIQDDRGNDPSFPLPEELIRAAESEWITFGNHTSSHAILSRLSPEKVKKDIMQAQHEFKMQLGIEPEIFAYPRGRKKDFNDAVVSVLKKCGFKAAFTMNPGVVKGKGDAFTLPRMGMSHVNDKILFKVKIIGLLGSVIHLRNRIMR